MSTKVPINPPEPDHAGISIPALGPTKLITRPNITPQFINNQETDIRTAIKRGLKEYLEQLSQQLNGGREVRFLRVLDTWAEPETLSVYPSAIVYTIGDGSYDSHNFIPTTNPNCKLPDGSYLTKTAEYEVDLTIEIYCTDPEERIGISLMMENAFCPVDWMYGFQLELPHYFNVRAKYEPLSNNFPDNESDAFQRNRIATFKFRGTAPVARLAGAASKQTLKPRLQLTVEGTDC